MSRFAALTSACPGFQSQTWSRRAILRIGGAGLFGLGLSTFLRAGETKSIKVRAKAVIFLHQYGGPSHHDTFDLKPRAPDVIRGEYKPIPTAASGISICEKLPELAKVMDKITLIRSMTHEMKNHNSAGYYSLTGHTPPTDDQRLRDSNDLFPAYGSVVDRLSPGPAGMPTFVAYPHVIRDGSITPGQYASFLGKKHDPLFVGQDPNSADFRLPELSLPANITPERLESRRAILKLIDQQSDLLEYSATARGIDAYDAKAIAMLTSPRVKQAFDLSAEPAKLRDQYGRTTYGQGCLLARRLVEAGVKFVNVYFAQFIGGGGNKEGWDTHGNNNKAMYPILNDYLLPITDQTLPTLLLDLESRGMLKDTLVVWMGEFGRTPRINANAGRDHWPQCYTALIAGGGVKGGFVHGSSDKNGAYPATDPVRPDDLAATIFQLLGIDPHTELPDPLNRPVRIAYGEAIQNVLV